MSKFSGRCDLYDDIEIFGLEMFLNPESKIYIGKTRIYPKSLKDLVPYYPHTLCSMGVDNVRNKIVAGYTNKPDWDNDCSTQAIKDYYKKLLDEELERWGEY